MRATIPVLIRIHNTCIYNTFFSCFKSFYQITRLKVKGIRQKYRINSMTEFHNK